MIHYPVSAKRFVEPLVNGLNSAGFDTQLWFENTEGLSAFSESISAPKRFVNLDITLNPFKLIKRIYTITRLLRQNRPSAIHTHQSRASLIPLTAAVLAGVKIRIYHNHGAPYLGYKGPVRLALWLLEYINSHLATNVLCVSASILDAMVKSRIVSKSKSACLGRGSVCGIDLADLCPEKLSQQNRKKMRDYLHISEDAFVVLYVGRPFKRKGFGDLLLAWRIFNESNSSAESEAVLLTAGCGFEDVVENFGSPPAGMIPLGYVTDIVSHYAAADVLVLPSYHEGMPYSLLEASAGRVAIVATDIPGINSLIEDSQTGLLVRPAQPAELAAAITKLKNEPELRGRLAENARKQIEKFFNRNISIKLLIEYYQGLGLIPEKSTPEKNDYCGKRR